MGLGFHFPGRNEENTPSWSYGGFGKFRRRLAAEIGINLHEMKGFLDGWRPWKMRDPIVPLLNHSDCDGVLTPAECAQVAPRLRELIAEWDDYDRDMALKLADAMDACVEAGVDLEFR